MTIVTEALLLWALITHLGLPLIGQVICVVLFLLGRFGGAIPLTSTKSLKL